MGLFDKKICAVCGKKKGLFGTKLSDGQYLCGDCTDAFTHFEPLSQIKFNQKIQLKDLSLVEYQDQLARRRNNLAELDEFSATKSFCGFIQIDEDAQQILFVEDRVFKNEKKLKEVNPPIFKIENLAFIRMTFQDGDVETTLTGKPMLESKVFLVMGFEDPIYDVIRVEVGKITSKTGLFGNVKTKTSPDIDALTKTISGMMDWEISWSADHDIVTPAADMDAYWRLAKRAKDYGYITGEDITECLRNYYGKDRIKIREIKKQYKM